MFGRLLCCLELLAGSPGTWLQSPGWYQDKDRSRHHQAALHAFLTTIIGIGGSPDEVDEPTLKRMASVVRGERRYWFIRSVGELVQRFEALALREVE